MGIVEMGCASGWLLSSLGKLAGRGGRLVCFEADAVHQRAAIEQTMKSAERKTPGLRTEVHATLMDWGALPEGGVDVFLSSHVLEHFTDPCPFLGGLWRILRPGGLVFTEVP